MRFLVDVNLPQRFRFFHDASFVHVADLGSRLTDTEIWEYALAHDLIILTKDADFYTRSVLSKRKPTVVHFQLGNCTLAELHHYFEHNWPNILQLATTYKLIVCRWNRIETY